MLYISRNIILERELLINLKISPATQEPAGEMPESPFLVTRNIKNRSALVLYKVMVKKGLNTLKNEASKRAEAPNESAEATGDPHSKRKAKHHKKHIFNNVFSQSNKQHEGQLSPGGEAEPKNADNLPAELLERANNERQNKIDEHFVKTKYDSMCGQPAKIKFQYYNINALNYDFRTPSGEMEAQEQLGKFDCHHFEKDETLGSFLVRIAQ
jgi:hypothetical protein